MLPPDTKYASLVLPLLVTAQRLWPVVRLRNRRAARDPTWLIQMPGGVVFGHGIPPVSCGLPLCPVLLPEGWLSLCKRSWTFSRVNVLAVVFEPSQGFLPAKLAGSPPQPQPEQRNNIRAARLVTSETAHLHQKPEQDASPVGARRAACRSHLSLVDTTVYQ